ncbi:MAG: 50S ribosomal protein L23 [Bacteroidetes bacterium]|nr:MAG: 50S ribosomal protein L23 [Bacteroidota bacterium]
MSVLKRPIITEKTVGYLERGLTQYGFEVDMQATKAQIKSEVEQVYEVKVESVNTMIVRGKQRMRYSKRGVIRGKSPNYKKAVVTLRPGDEIDFYKHI